MPNSSTEKCLVIITVPASARAMVKTLTMPKEMVLATKRGLDCEDFEFNFDIQLTDWNSLLL
jgi:hypothetical protein